MSKFIPNYSAIAAPLRLLLEKETEWHWETAQNQALNELKQAITNAPVLKYFDSTKETTISVDASSKGIGAVLLQESRPVAYASKSLTTTQQNYAQIEKEMLAIVFGCTKFHDYIYGLPKVTAESDHKPLEAILAKLLHAAPARLQRMIMSVQKYPIHVTYKPGKELFIADTLSRAPLPEEAGDLEFAEYDINVLHTLPITESKLAELKEQTKKENTLQTLTHVILNGWPDSKADTPPVIRPYRSYRDELTHQHGILFKGNKVLIPTSMQHAMLRLVHNAHLGVEKCKRRARDIMFWPNMSAQIADLVSNCPTCSTYQKKNVREPLLSHPIPTRPWERVGTDLFEVNGKHYLILVDYYSNFVEIDELRDTTSKQVINRCKCQFARHGIPDTLMSDNGPQFSSAKFRQFSVTYQFIHITSSFHYPQSNRKAERAVQTIKNLTKKSQTDNKDFQLALLDFRNTPNQ